MNGDRPPRTVLIDIDIPFWRTSLLMVKWSIAAVPAIVVLTLVLGGLWAVALNLVIRLSADLPIAP